MTTTAIAIDESLPLPDTVIRGKVRWLYAYFPIIRAGPNYPLFYW